MTTAYMLQVRFTFYKFWNLGGVGLEIFFYEIDLKGTYTFAIRNNSNDTVWVNGFVNY